MDLNSNKEKSKKSESEVYREERKKRLAKTNKKLAKTSPTAIKRKKTIRRIILIAVLAIAVLAITGGILVSAGVPQKTMNAVKVGDKEVSVADYNFYYNYAKIQYVNNLSNQFGESNLESILQMYNLNLNASLEKQKCSVDPEKGEDYTWHDYFHDSSINQIKYSVALAEKAYSEGMTLSDEEKTSIEDQIKAYEEAAKTNNLSVAAYLSRQYGKGVTLNSIRGLLERQYVAVNYETKIREDVKNTDQELEDFYKENIDSYDEVTYRALSFNSSAATDATDEEKTAAMNEAKAKAEEMNKAVTDEASFIEQAKKNAPEDQKEEYEDDSKTLQSKKTKSSISDTALADWLFDDSRKAGDTSVIEGSSSYQVVYLVQTKARDEVKVVDVRHILTSFSTLNGELSTEKTEYTDEEKAKTKEVADEIYNDWKNGAATEDSFAELAKEKSDDTGSKEAGGLYEDVYQGYMTEKFNDWCFDSARKPGDTGIVETEYGYHIMYYVAQGEERWKNKSDTELTSKKVEEAVEALTNEMSFSTHNFALWLANK